MKTFFLISALLLGWAATTGAAIYQYTDESGQVHYTNDLSSVPTEKLDQVTETEETESGPSASPSPTYPNIEYPILQNAQALENKRLMEKKQAQKKAELEAEYEALLKEKEALDNDESFQKRREKKKYKNRPYILELVTREAEINKRLAEVERELKKY